MLTQLYMSTGARPRDANVRTCNVQNTHHTACRTQENFHNTCALISAARTAVGTLTASRHDLGHPGQVNQNVLRC